MMRHHYQHPNIINIYFSAKMAPFTNELEDNFVITATPLRHYANSN
jgi:hypothetical protein